MGNISVNKLGGISIALGPVIALISYLVQPGGLLNGNIDPSDASAAILETVSNSTMAHITGFTVILGLGMLVYGISTVVANMKGGNGEALSRYASLFWVVALAAWTIQSGLGHILAGQGAAIAAGSGALAGVLYAASQGISNIAGAAAAVGITALALAASTRDDFNKIFSLVVAASGIVAVVCAVTGLSDPAQANLMTQIGAICYIIWTIWSVMLGRDLIKKG
jgi:hypothetical protein